MPGAGEAEPEVMRIGELLLLAALWMVFGFMVWYYASPWHGTPVRLIADGLLEAVLGPAFRDLVPNPERAFEFLARTSIPFTFPDGSRQALGFVVNPLVFGYGLPLLFGLTMATDLALLKKLLVVAVGYAVVLGVQTWGVFWEVLKTLAFDFGPEATAAVTNAGVPLEAVALCYQLGVLILPPLAPVIVWVVGNRREIERFAARGRGPRP